jgi:hypothetical protein
VSPEESFQSGVSEAGDQPARDMQDAVAALARQGVSYRIDFGRKGCPAKPSFRARVGIEIEHGRPPRRTNSEEVPLLTEAEVQRSFRNLFKSKDVSPDTFERAEALLEELRAESPLRHRLSVELEEIRKLHSARA